MARADTLAALRRSLLALLSAGSPLPALGSADWAELDRIAAEHRLQPLLHARHRGDPALPPAIAKSWQAAHRAATMVALAQRAELLETTALLRAHGHAPLALKGAWLARHAYPDPALRPMRDLDLLLTPESVLDGFNLLRAAGYAQAFDAEMPLEAVIRLDKHLPPLIGPRGTLIELHHHLWEREGRLDHSSPLADEAAVRARAVTDAEGVAYPAAPDMCAHLIIHAAYSHRLDCGPLLLPDLAHLLRKERLDWADFWARATREGWRGGARLVMALVARHDPQAVPEFGAEAGPPAPRDLLDAAPDLLLQDLATRRSAGVAAKTINQGARGLLARISGRREAEGEQAAHRDTSGEGGAARWAASRAWRTLSELARADVRRQSRELARLSRWLDQ